MTDQYIEAVGGNGSLKYVVGGQTEFTIMDNLDKWQSHKRSGSHEFTIKTINEITSLPEYVDDPAMLCNVLKIIWDAPNITLFNSIANNMGLVQPVHIAYHTLFWKLKELIEVISVLYLKFVQKINVPEQLTEWKTYIETNQVDTSSIILWNNFHKQSPSFGKYFKVNYEYKGYCPRASKERIQLLLQFPVDTLITEIDQSGAIKIAPILDPTVHGRLLGLSKLIMQHSTDIEQINKCPRKKITWSASTEQMMDEFMREWLAFNECLKPYLVEYEKNNIELSKIINELSTILGDLKSKLMGGLN